MKKIVPLCITSLIVGYVICYFTINYKTIEGKQLTFYLPLNQEITGIYDYKLDCKTQKYAALVAGKENTIFPKSYIRLESGSEQSVIYVEGDKANFFGAEYVVVQDDSSFLVLFRNNSISGLTEVVTINKETGAGFDTKTTGVHLAGMPISDTYFLSCSQI